jgi:hypothetical protein
MLLWTHRRVVIHQQSMLRATRADCSSASIVTAKNAFGHPLHGGGPVSVNLPDISCRALRCDVHKHLACPCFKWAGNDVAKTLLDPRTRSLIGIGCSGLIVEDSDARYLIVTHIHEVIRHKSRHSPQLRYKLLLNSLGNLLRLPCCHLIRRMLAYIVALLLPVRETLLEPERNEAYPVYWHHHVIRTVKHSFYGLNLSHATARRLYLLYNMRHPTAYRR